MASLRKSFDAILGGRSDANVRFNELRRVVLALGFQERIRGDHYIYSRQDVDEIINIQPLGGGKAKPYQVKQVRQLIVRYRLGLE